MAKETKLEKGMRRLVSQPGEMEVTKRPNKKKPKK